mgnify:CR=1 FL=1
MAQVKTTAGFILESAIINSTRQVEPIDILGLVTDIEIFEHMDLPYITGQVAIIDTFRIYDRLDFQGAEYFTIKITQNKFYLITILLLLFISLQLDGLNDKLKILIELSK